MRKNMAATIVYSAVVGMMVFGLAGCGKKEAADTGKASDEAQTENVASAPATMPDVTGTYMGEAGEGDAAQRLTLTLNADNTAMVKVEYLNGQPAMSQSGTWEAGANNVINFNYGGEGSMMTMPMTLDGDHLMVGGEMATAMGVSEISLMKQMAEPMEEDPHAGHDH